LDARGLLRGCRCEIGDQGEREREEANRGVRLHCEHEGAYLYWKAARIDWRFFPPPGSQEARNMLRIACCTAALSLVVSSPLLGQSICHAEYDGNNYNNNISMGGPNLILAVQFTAPSSFSVSRMEIFTGE